MEQLQAQLAYTHDKVEKAEIFHVEKSDTSLGDSAA